MKKELLERLQRLSFTEAAELAEKFSAQDLAKILNELYK